MVQAVACQALRPFADRSGGWIGFSVANALPNPPPLRGPSQAPSGPQDGKEDATAQSGVELRRASAVQGATLGR